MKLLRLHVENFGKLQNFDLELSDGLNVLYQKNGWGKSTLAVFIKAMLYGLPASTKRSLDENERKKYTPWQGGAFGGSLEFETADGAFRVERFFGAKEAADSFALFDLATNLPSSRYSAALGEELFGIDAEGFERSTYLSQRMPEGTRENISISAKLGNLLDDVGDIGSYDLAVEALEKRRKFYVLSGNRGAIAEAEAEQIAKQRELETCRLKEEALQAQRAELADAVTRIKALQKTAEEANRRLQNAGLAREKQALLNQKTAMQKELEALAAQKAENDAFFRAGVPTGAEFADARALYDKLRKTSGRLEAIPKHDLMPWRRRYPADTAQADLATAEAENRRLGSLREERAALLGRQKANDLSQRFPNGAPSKEEVERAFSDLEKAKEAQARIHTLSSAKPKKASPALLLLGLLGLLGGLVCLLFSSYSPALLIGGIALLLAGALLSFLFLRGRASSKRAKAEFAKRITEAETARSKALDAIHALLNRYRLSAGTDLSRTLNELDILSRQYRESQESRRTLGERLAALDRRRTESAEKIVSILSGFGIEACKKDDYREELGRVYRELSELARMETEDRQRTAVENDLQELKAVLLPFLRRYDPAGQLRAGECLDRISQMCDERDRLLRQINEKERALAGFVSKNRLEGLTDAGDVGEFDRLTAEGAELRRRIEAEQESAARLRSQIEKLSAETDRIPELEASLAQSAEKIADYRANAATIANTAKLLEEAKLALSTRYLDGMQKSFARSLSMLTGEDSTEALMDTSFTVRLREGGQTRTMESFSRGRRDAVQFCVRLSLTDALYAEGEKPFLLLDDPFVNLDDDRLAAARSLLDRLAEDYQILYLICHKERV